MVENTILLYELWGEMIMADNNSGKAGSKISEISGTQYRKKFFLLNQAVQNH